MGATARTGTRSKGPDYEVAIIGAGISGIGAAIALRRAGIDDFVILDRGSDIGGTWRDNTYPGIGVDIPSQAYQFSYAMKPDWSRTFAKGAEVKSYLDDCADRYDVRRFVRLDSDVTEREWDDDRHLWRLTVSGRPLTARFVISAIGAFVAPKPPDIEGLDDFRGTTLHSTAWDHSNHFMIFGPYGWTGGTWHELVETASNHIIRVIGETRRRGATAVEVREEPTDRWTAFAVERMAHSLWGLGDCASANSYYFDHHGDTPFARPTTTQQAWKASRTFPLDDYEYRYPQPKPLRAPRTRTGASA